MRIMVTFPKEHDRRSGQVYCRLDIEIIEFGRHLENQECEGLDLLGNAFS